MDPYPDPSLPRLNGGRLKSRAAPRTASAALAAERPRARAGAAGTAGRVNRCQHSTPDRVSRLTPPVSRHDRPKYNRIEQHSMAQAKTLQMCATDKSMFLLSSSCNTQGNDTKCRQYFTSVESKFLKLMSSILECSFFYTVYQYIRYYDQTRTWILRR
jgi:hypothetical protein